MAWVNATVLAAGKGWVLAMLAMLGPSGPARGCAWLRSRRQAAPPLPSAARRDRRRASGRKASRAFDSWPPARVEQKAAKRGYLAPWLLP